KLTEGLARIVKQRTRGLVVRAGTFDELGRSPVVAVVGHMVTAAVYGGYQVHRFPFRVAAGCDHLGSQVLRHGLNVLHHLGRILKDVVIYALQYETTPLTAFLFYGDGVRIVDMPQRNRFYIHEATLKLKLASQFLPIHLLHETIPSFWFPVAPGAASGTICIPRGSRSTNLRLTYRTEPTAPGCELGHSALTNPAVLEVSCRFAVHTKGVTPLMISQKYSPDTRRVPNCRRQRYLEASSCRRPRTPADFPVPRPQSVLELFEAQIECC